MMGPGTPAAMAALHARAFPDARPWGEDAFAALLERPATHAVIAPHGFALIQVIPPEAELLTIAVDPARQGQGLGRALLTRTMLQAAKLGAEIVFLEVDAENTAARALYAAAGFARTGRRAAYYAHADGHRSDAILLSKALDGAAPDAP